MLNLDEKIEEANDILLDKGGSAELGGFPKPLTDLELLREFLDKPFFLRGDHGAS